MNSLITHKILMALTGLFFIFWVIMHLAGNLEIYFGQDAINEYSELLRTFPKLLWSMRIALIGSFVLHVFLSIKLARHNKQARPAKYIAKKNVLSSLASRTMLISGLLLLFFIAFHLAHFSMGLVYPSYNNLIDSQGRHDVYSMTIIGFQNVYISIAYIVAQIFLALQINHGFSSAAQTLGIANVRVAGYLKNGGLIFGSPIFNGEL